MKTINVLPVEELEPCLIDGIKMVSVVITSEQDMQRTEELCDYYGYMFAASSVGINVKQVVMKC